MARQSRRKGRKRTAFTVLGWFIFGVFMVSMLAAYIANQVTISSKRAELETLKEQIAQQQTENEEMERLLRFCCAQ